MKIVLDTNVLVSGIFFGGPPGTILEAWQDGQVELAVSLEIFAEYERVGGELAAKHPNIDPATLLTLIALGAELCDCPTLQEQVCADPDDDKFLACALATGSKHVVSGDNLLLSVSGYGGIQVIRPRSFIEQYLKANS
ncbi:MAG: putative toxin-antitoxin system toxin component, PIN family [Pirellulales bacterium]